jgi:uncharacterized protein YecT (DUF1311 family)
MVKKIFINYRRSINLKDAQLLHAALCRRFGQSRVFLDVSGLDGGDHWLHTLEKQVDASSAMVSLIGKNWADVADETGQRRLDNPNDFVRFEIARAFSREMPVLPVLIDGATMPDISRLPSHLAPLTFSQAMLLREESFDDDAKRIAERLKLLLAMAGRQGIASWKVGAMLLAAIAAGIAAGPYLLTKTRAPILLDQVDMATDQQSDNSNPGPSFDCATAKRPDELAICNNKELAGMDARLNSQYLKLKAIFKESPDKDQLRVQSQRGWVDLIRRACGSDENCLSVLYRCKFNELKIVAQNPN